jgi:cytochrome c-type biogenesis protein CcmH/NrfF
MTAPTRQRISRWLLALAVATASGPARLDAQQTERAKKIGKRLICMCGCNQIVTACNHVGCTVSASMLKKLDQEVARNEPEDLTIQSFVQEFGQKVVAEPPSTGFNRIAWFIPGAAFATGLGIVLLVIVQWRRRQTPAPAGLGVSQEVLARAREEADRETDA